MADPKNAKPSKASKKEQEILDLIASTRYDDNTPPPEQVVVLTIGDQPVGTLGSMVCLTGLPKAGKGAFLKIILASSALLSDYCGIKLTMPPDRPGILIYDTEHSGYEYWRLIQNVKKMMDRTRLPPNIQPYRCRRLLPSQIIMMLRYQLAQDPTVSVVVIDTLLDLCNDFNNVQESLELGRMFKELEEDFNVLILGVLHLTKRDRMSLGHLGSTMDKWSRAVTRIDKDQTGKFFTLSCEYQRDCPEFDPITVTYSAGLLTSVALQPKNKQANEVNPYDVANTEHKYMIDQVLGADDIAYEDITKHLSELKDITVKKAKEYVKMWQAKGWIYKNRKTKLFAVPRNSELNSIHFKLNTA